MPASTVEATHNNPVSHVVQMIITGAHNRQPSIAPNAFISHHKVFIQADKRAWLPSCLYHTLIHFMDSTCVAAAGATTDEEKYTGGI